MLKGKQTNKQNLEFVSIKSGYHKVRKITVMKTEVGLSF